MEPIIGKVSYKDLTPEEIDRFKREAELMRVEAIHDMFRTIFQSIGHAAVAIFRFAERAVTGHKVSGLHYR